MTSVGFTKWPRGRAGWTVALVSGAALLVGCGSSVTAPPERAPVVGGQERAFFPSPLASAEDLVPFELAREIERLHGELLRVGATFEVQASIEELAGRHDLPPVVVLLAQLRRLEGRETDARLLLAPLVANVSIPDTVVPGTGVEADPVSAEPGWAVPFVVDGRAAESLGEIVDAWTRYRHATELGWNGAVGARAAELEPRAIEVLGLRVRDALSRSRVEDAISSLFWLERWAPQEDVTIEAVAAVAAATEDTEREAEALAALVARRPGDRLLLERLAEVALIRGDAASAIGLLQDLLLQYPDDPVLEGRLGVAKVQFRLAVLPQPVQAVAREPLLQRAGFARLLYWLVPGVRIQAAESAPIANDILDRSDRTEIVRVLGWGLLEVQAGVHEFDPERPLRRREALLGTMRAMRFTGTGSCAAPLELNPRPSNDTLCRLGFECGLLDDPDLCLPEAEVSGPEAIALLARGLEPR